MTFARFALDNVRDARSMGCRYLWRHRPRWRSDEVTVRIKDVGNVVLRRNTSDARVFSQVFAEQQYNLAWYPQFADVVARYDEILRSNRRPLIIDAGANNGASALWFHGQFPEARIVAIEPEPSSALICARNAAGTEVEVVQAAVGSQSGTAALVTADRASWAVGTTRCDGGEVPIVTINEIVAERGSECELFIVKIDIEGFESDLFAANTEWVADATVIIVEPHDYLYPEAGPSHNFQTVLAPEGRDLLVAGENLVYVKRSSCRDVRARSAAHESTAVSSPTDSVHRRQVGVR